MNNSGTHKAASLFRWTARIIGLPVTLLVFYTFTLMNIETVFMRIPHSMPGISAHLPLTLSVVINSLFGILVLSAYVFAWWKERLSGFMFVLSSLCVIGMMIFLRIQNSRYFEPPPFQWTTNYLGGWWMEWAWTGGLPLLVIGILFLLASWLSQKKAILARAESAVVAES
jgi:hypothetical protein